MNRITMQSVVAVTLTTLVLAGIPQGARAGMIPTSLAIQAQAAPERAGNLARVQAGLERAEVRAGLQRHGVQPEEAARRAALLSDAELAQLADRMDRAPAGGDAGLLAVIGIVFIVLLVLDYLDVVHVFHHRR